jgi:hypothetical protein
MDEVERFSLTPSGELLRSGVPDLMCAFAVLADAEFARRLWGDLGQSVRTRAGACETTRRVLPFGLFEAAAAHG